MLFRLKIEFDPLIKEMFENIPDEFWEDSKNTFFDPDMGGGQFLAVIQDTLRHKYNKTDEEIASRLFGMATNKFTLNYAVSKHKLLGTYYFGDFLKKEFDMKFDCIVGNPPYQGQSMLHQRFFNLGVNLLEENGVLAFIQPAIVYLNKKEKTDVNSQMMRDNIKKYHVITKIIDPRVFEAAGNFNDLSITILKKAEDKETIAELTYPSGKVFKNIKLENVTKTELDPDIYEGIVQKYKSYISKNGCLADLLTEKQTTKATLTKLRGNPGKDDWYTFIPKDEKYWNSDSVFGIKAKNDIEIQNIYSYLMSNPARFGLAIYKFAGDLRGGATNGVPIVDFSKTYTDQELSDLFGLNALEKNAIDNLLEDYYGRNDS